MPYILIVSGVMSYTQRIMSNHKGELFLVLMLAMLLHTCEGRAVRNLYDICPTRRHDRSHEVTLRQITDLCDIIRKKIEQLQDDYHTSGRISHGDRHWLESIKFEQLPAMKSYEKEEELIFETYHGLVKFVYFLELSQNDEYNNFGKGDQSYFEEFQDIVAGHADQVYNIESLLCEVAGVIHNKGLWTSFQRQERVGDEVVTAASDIDTRQSQLHRDYIFLEHAARYLNHLKNQAPTYLNRS